ncbi:MAG: chloramphenicol phosphotransferase [bacterium]
MNAPGRIVCLNGPSSSGKTSIGRSLQHLMLPEAWFLCGIDTFLSMASKQAHGPQVISEWRPAPGGGVQPVLTPDGLSLIGSMYEAVAALVAGGSNIVFDDVSLSEPLLGRCATAFAPFESLFVGVHCDRAVLIERERIRADRIEGTAIGMSSAVHQSALYDLEVDTTSASAEECARLIASRLRSGPAGTAFGQLRRRIERL